VATRGSSVVKDERPTLQLRRDSARALVAAFGVQ
jgi:hypothetical protein